MPQILTLSLPDRMKKSLLRYHVNFTRNENSRTCFQETEGSVIFRVSNRENSPPSPTVPPWAPERTFPNTLGPIFNCGSLHRLGYRRISSIGYCDSGLPNHRPLGAVPWDHRANIPRAHDGTMLNVPSSDQFGAALGLYMEEFKEEKELHALTHHIHFSPSKCWHILAPSATSYNPSCSNASVLPPSLRYLQAILAHMITGRQESTGIVNTHDTYFLWCMSHEHVIDLAYFIALMSPQGISSMLSMRMIKRHRGTYPLQYCLAQSTEEEAYEDIPDDICQHLHISSPVPPRKPSSDEDV
ncbi:hypothetical protein GOBAR_AA08116 [Gossypium barbadense]|uniref:Uncharacterized protein n=1 Tax=Gossypium barbadense TaxID=3634 RepID=A0A2P5YAC1_GOSBA|nr:hypothetical protein GOBAR_AA08116 [Gossypium barbadense]